MTLSRLTAAAVAALAAACALTASASSATKGCATVGYSYAGIQTSTPRRGISARVTVTRISAVTSGHIAGWVGVGGAGQGVNGADEWIQIGISSVPGGATEVYVEVAQPGQRPTYTVVSAIAAGQTRTLAVYEVAPTIWVATVDGAPVVQPVMLPGSHGTWKGMAMAESYDGGATQCNSYGIQFDDIRVSDFTGIWFPTQHPTPFTSGGHSLTATAPSSYAANRR